MTCGGTAAPLAVLRGFGSRPTSQRAESFHHGAVVWQERRRSEVGLGQLVPTIETSEIAVLSWSGSPGTVATTSMSTQLAVTPTAIRCMVG
jgi:hypothetical protein